MISIYTLDNLKPEVAKKLETGALILADVKWGDIKLEYQRIAVKADVIVVQYGDAGKVMKNRFGDTGMVILMSRIFEHEELNPPPKVDIPTFDPINLRGHLIKLRSDALNDLNGYYEYRGRKYKSAVPYEKLKLLNGLLEDFFHVTFENPEASSFTIQRDLAYDAYNNLLGLNDQEGAALRRQMIEQGIING